MLPLVGKTVSSRFRKTLEAGSENAPGRLQRSTKVQRFIDNTCMTGNSQFCSLPCGNVSVHFLGMFLFSKYIYSGFELVKQNRFAKISKSNKEKGPKKAKVFFGSTNHFMKNVKSFKFLQTNLVKFCKFNSLPFFV